MIPRYIFCSTAYTYELTLAEIALLKAQFDHGTLLSNMEAAVSDYQLQVQKVLFQRFLNHFFTTNILNSCSEV